MKEMHTLLLVTGTAPEKFPEAKLFGADGLLIDLEASVPLQQKEVARNNAISYINREKNLTIGVRINSIQEKDGFLDIVAIIKTEIKPKFIVLSKVELPEEVIILDHLFATQPIPYVILIESLRAMDQAEAIINASQNIIGLSFGIKDISADLG